MRNVERVKLTKLNWKVSAEDEDRAREKRAEMNDATAAVKARIAGA